MLQKTFKNIKKGMNATGIFEYLNSYEAKDKFEGTVVSDLLTPQSILRALEKRALVRVVATIEKILSD